MFGSCKGSPDAGGICEPARLCQLVPWSERVDGWDMLTSHDITFLQDGSVYSTDQPRCEMWTHSVSSPGDKPRPMMASIGRAHQRRGAMHMYSVFRTSTLAWVDPNIARKLERKAPLIHHVWSFCPFATAMQLQLGYISCFETKPNFLWTPHGWHLPDAWWYVRDHTCKSQRAYSAYIGFPVFAFMRPVGACWFGQGPSPQVLHGLRQVCRISWQLTCCTTSLLALRLLPNRLLRAAALQNLWTAIQWLGDVRGIHIPS